MTDTIVIDESTESVVVVDVDAPVSIVESARGAPGPSGAIGSVRVETPAGTIDGVNASFTTAVPFALGTTVLYLNGLAQSVPDDYVEATAQSVTLDAPPEPGDRLRISYMEG